MSIAALAPRRTVSVVPRHRDTPDVGADLGAGVRRGARLAVRATGWLTLSAVVVVFAFLAVGPHVLGYRTATMLTGSMEPMIAPGDVVVSVPRPVDEVAVGDVISYHIPIEDHRVETHRVTAVDQGPTGQPVVRTQGDANPGVDPWTATLDGDVVWETVAVVPRLGTAIRVLRAPVFQTYVFWGGLVGLVGLGLAMIWGRDEQTAPEGRRAGAGGPTIDPVSGAPGGTGQSSGDDMAPEDGPVTGDPGCLDRAVLAKLAADMEDESFARAFARRYQQLLERRVTRIDEALTAADLDKAMDALLSLKVSSTTAGTRELAGLAAEIEGDVRRTDLGSARRRATALRDAADRADQALTDYLQS